jgi:hypothetical protein
MMLKNLATIPGKSPEQPCILQFPKPAIENPDSDSAI